MKKKVCLFILEDSIFLQEMLVYVFEKAGIEVVGVASSGKIALSAIKQLKPDIVWVDIVLPGVNGFAVINKIKSFLKDIKVIASSSLKNEHIFLQSEIAGAVDFIQKPFKSEDIVNAVFSAMKNTKKEHEVAA